jgi:hypothetical protein
MKKLVYCALVCSVLSAIASAQAEKRFPGVSAPQMEMLRAARKVTPIPLPTWVPAGFKVEKVQIKLGSMVPIEDRVLAIIYSRKLPNGKVQRFALEAGFEGLGDLPYDTTNTVRSAVGKIEIAFEPPDLDGGGKKLKNFVMTQWFSVGKTAWHYDGMHGANTENGGVTMISITDTQKILGSLQRF